MKKVLSILMVLTLLFSFAACSNNTNNEGSPDAQQPSTQSAAAGQDNQGDASEPSGADGQSDTSEPSGTEPETGSDSLVVYFSWSGNTENVAESIQRQTDSDIFEIVPATPYSEDYNTVLDVAQQEQRNNARPAISGTIEDIERYDVIYVGFPNWWGDMPMILYTFFDTYDLSGKTVALFCTSGGSGLSNTVNEVRALEPDANVTEGLHIGSGASSNPDNAVSEWLDRIGQ